MYVVDKFFALQNGDNELVLDFLDGVLNFYRVKDGQLEYCTMSRGKRTWGNFSWHQLTAVDILQHMVLHTVVADWLRERLRLVPVDQVGQEVYGDIATRLFRQARRTEAAFKLQVVKWPPWDH